MTEIMDRLALNSQTTPLASLEEFASAAAEAGFERVECSAEVLESSTEASVKILARHGLSLVGVSPSPALLDWHWAWSEELRELLRIELQRAAALGARYFVLPFMRPHGNHESVERALAEAVPLARAAGVSLAVEPIGHYDVLRRAEQLAPLLLDQDPSVVGLLLDSFHFFRAGHELSDLDVYAGVAVAGIQLSNVNSQPDDEALGYRDRTFPLDGRWPVLEFAGEASRRFPTAPLVVEVIGDLARATPTRQGAAQAYAQLEVIADHLSQEALHG